MSDAEERAARRVGPVRAVPRARRRPAARRAQTSGSAARIAERSRSPSSSQATNGTIDDLQVAEHGGEPGADVGDRLVPEREVGGEEDAGDQGEPRCAPGARRAALPPGEGARSGIAYAQRQSAAVTGWTSARSTRMAEKAIMSAPRTPATTGLSLTARSTPCRPAEAEPLVDARDVVVGGRQEHGRDAAASACSTSAAVTAAPSPWRRRAGSVATPTISATPSSGRCVPAATGRCRPRPPR